MALSRALQRVGCSSGLCRSLEMILPPREDQHCGMAPKGSRENLLGTHRTPEALALASLENQVTAATPPTLLIHTQEDTTVPIENSIRFFQALTKAHVPAEFYAFEHGSHGMGMKPEFGTASDWPKRAEEWLRNRGLLTAVKH